MDFQKIDTIAAAERGFTYVFKDAYGEDTDCTVDVIGVGSRTYKLAKEKITQAETQYYRKYQKELPQEESDELYIDMIAKCMKGWTNVSEGDKEIPFSYENAVTMLNKYPLFRSQVLTAIHDVVAMLEGK